MNRLVRTTIPRCWNGASNLVIVCHGERMCRKLGTSRQLSADEMGDHCQAHVLSSPFNPIPTGPYPPIADFVMSTWRNNDNNIDEDLMKKVSIVDTNTKMKRTYGDQYRTMGGLAANLMHKLNVGEGDCVAIYCPNHVDYLPVALAVTITGALLTPINPLYTVDELVRAFRISKSSILVVHQNNMQVAMTALDILQPPGQPKQIRHVIVIQNDDASKSHTLPHGAIALDDLRYHNNPLYQTVPAVQGQTAQHLSLLPYSSGTTGSPKGVCLTHQNIVANLYQLDAIEGPGTQSNCVVSSPLPFFHIYAFTTNLLYGAWKGITLVANSGRFDLAEYLQSLQDYKVNRTYIVPPILAGLARHPMVDKFDLSSLQVILSAAAPAGAALEEMAERRIGCTVKQCWGMSELSPLGTSQQDTNVKHGSIGPLAASTLGKIVDEQGNSLGPHQSGELLIKGPQVMQGYYNEPEKTAEALSRSGWLRTGDVAHYDEDGFFFITDRVKDMIKVRGFPVAPAELEALLLTHAAVADAAVVATAFGENELPRAHIVLKSTWEAQQTTAQQIQDWVKERVAPYKRLDGGIVFTDQIPKSATGKILRRLLMKK